MNAARIAERLFQSTLAPLVLGGTVAPGHAIGAQAAWALGGGDAPSDRVLADGSTRRAFDERGRWRRSTRSPR